MALINFPPTPTNGDYYPVVPAVGQNQYQYESATLTWRLLGPSTGVTPGTYGDSTNVAQFTVDTQGRLTSAVDVPIVFPTAITFVSAPTASTDVGTSGDVAVDSTYLYLNTGAKWERIAWDTTPW